MQIVWIDFSGLSCYRAISLISWLWVCRVCVCVCGRECVRVCECVYSGAQSFCAIMLALNLIDFKVAAKQRKQKTNSGKNEREREKWERSEGREEREETSVRKRGKRVEVVYCMGSAHKTINWHMQHTRNRLNYLPPNLIIHLSYPHIPYS